VRLLFASDLHGITPLYDSLEILSRKFKPDLIILGGDLLPKSCEKGDLLGAQRYFAANTFSLYGLKLHEINPDVEVGVMLGNDDYRIMRKELEKIEYEHTIKLIDNNVWETKSSWQVIGINLVPETPFLLKDMERRDCEIDPVYYPSIQAIYSTDSGVDSISSPEWFASHASLESELTNLTPIGAPERTIFVSHAPPYSTPLDLTMNGNHVGSKSIRQYIEKYQPRICLHGHIHESFYVSGSYVFQIGRSVCFNPGQIHGPVLDAVIIDTEEDWLNHRHTMGHAPPSEAGLAMLKAPVC